MEARMSPIAEEEDIHDISSPRILQTGERPPVHPPLSYSQVLQETRSGKSNFRLRQTPSVQAQTLIDEGSEIEEDEWLAGEEDAFRFVQPRRLSSWVHDDAVSACFKCHAEFTVLLRKHHCRACGRIFCHSCSNQRLVIPSDYEASPLLRPYYGTFASSATDVIGSGLGWVLSTTYSSDLDQPIAKESAAPVSQNSEAIREREKFLRSVERLQEHYPHVVKGFKPSASLADTARESSDVASTRPKVQPVDPYVPEGTTAPQRVCDDCANALYQRRQHQHTVKVLELCEFDIQELRKLGQVCRKWHRASILCLSSFRQIQYYLPSHTLSRREIRLLRINCRFLKGHSKWLVQLLKTTDWKDENNVATVLDLLSQPRRFGCMMTMCSRLCRERFVPVDAFEVLEECINVEQEFRNLPSDIVQTALQSLKKLSVEAIRSSNSQEWICYLPLLVRLLQSDTSLTEHSLLGKAMLDQAVRDPLFLNDLFWELNLRSEDRKVRRVLDAFKQRLLMHVASSCSPDAVEKLIRGQELMHILSSIPRRLPNADARCYLRNITQRSRVFDLESSPIHLPVDPSVRIHGLLFETLEVKSSAEAPIVVECEKAERVLRNTLVEPCRYKIMYKCDDLRKDAIVQNIITTMYAILRQETEMDLRVKTYRVLPTSTDDGLIEIVRDAETLYAIIRDYGNIMNFLHRYNGHRTMKEIKGSFRESLAAYTVITFLLGVGDRHAENVMLTKGGILFHIDYGFILGMDPKPLQPPMRLDSYMIDALGGAQEYDDFKELCVVAFNCLRRHVTLIMYLLSCVIKATPEIIDFEAGDNGYTMAELQAFVIERFLPGQSDEEAATALKLRMEGKLNERIGMSVSDFVHAHTSEKTVSRSMSSVGETVSTVATTLSSGASNLFKYVVGGSE